jgi:enoyl-CoA hydratase
MYVDVAIEDGVAIVTISRPEALNALNGDVLQELCTILDDIENDPGVRALVITGSGNKAFVAGGDIAHMSKLSPQQAKEFSELGHTTLGKIASSQKPVIAAVNGYALGGGLELALCCHFRLASANARMGLPEVSLGVIPGYAGTQRLPRLVGQGKALEMITSGEPIDAEEALRCGLVNRVVPQEELLPACLAIAGKIASRGPVAVGFALEAVRRGLDCGLAEGSALESAHFGLLWSTADMREGCGAFLEKRKPSFQGR